ncbi:MAG: Uma2 family endonuclease [Sciscionella sp.]
MTAITWPDHLLSLEDWATLPEDTSRCYELVEGNLQVCPRPVFAHQVALSELGYQLRGQLPSGHRAIPEVEVVVFDTWPPTIRVPDLVVVPTALARSNPARCAASDVLQVVEVLSPGSVRTDRIAKFAEYADAGIEYYWLVDLVPPVTLTAHQLIDGEYQIIGEGSDVMELESPFPVTIDLAALLS